MHQTVTRFGCDGFLMYACWFSVTQMRQVCLFTPKIKMSLYEKMIFFCQNRHLTHVLQHYHDFQSIAAILPSVVRAFTQPYSLDGRMKQIICQMRHELSVTFHEISTRWKKKTLDGGLNVLEGVTHNFLN